MHYVAEGMHSITGKRALNLRAVCTKLSVFTRNGKLTEIYEKFVKERLNPLKADVKKFIVNS